MNNKIVVAALLVLTAWASAARAAPEDVTVADPSRWFKSEDTPRGRYGNHLIEARAAYAQALQECKSGPPAAARQCRNDARSAMKEDLARARRILDHAQSND
ncbi:hypothetical protein [Herbaspirillum sp. YR522]|uniref:hypothetical protein n=1 Tax=Herbaspirillum sp. YR522 TaxID=1144342 RepID=UPI00026FC4E9|nr:hypothetical protein [Herbaspirillum sp. YR522]EJN02725.1 hypothetical protein PMI40_03085 [Herbaspirillum sp. YR522]